MRAWRYMAFGPVESAAQIVEIDPPAPAAGEVRVQVEWVSLNPLDWKLVEGQFRRFAKSAPPCGIGTEFAGTVVALGSGLSAPPLGTRVVGFISPFERPPGALQPQVVLPASAVVPLAEGIAADLGCTLPVAGASALQMCRQAGVTGVKAGRRVLVHGAAGGVGSYAVQVARILGARVSATGSGDSLPLLQALGADALIDYRTRPPAAWGGPFDAVLDCASTLTDADLATLLPDGGIAVATLPRFPGVVLDVLLNPLRRLKRHTLRLSHRAADLQQLMAWVAAGRLHPQIAARLPFEQAREALLRSRSGHVHGKLLVQVG